jgi:3-oxoacyl-[acyl-carrier protein] reductase
VIKKKVLILGASSDIGLKVVNKFLQNSWEVHAHFNQNKYELLNIKSNYNDLNFFKLNLFAKFNRIEDKIKKLNLNNFSSYINLVGALDSKSFKESNYNDQIKILSANTLYPAHILKTILPSMINNKFGRILNCSSIGVKFGGGTNNYNYSLSKHLMEFIPSESKKWSKNNVLINNLRIGVTKTKLHSKIGKKNMKERIKLIPIGRMANTKEISDYIFYLSSENNSFITNETLSISGGE